METKEQMAKEYVESIPQFEDRKRYCEEDFKAGWDAALKSQWIKVEEKKPGLYDKILVLYRVKNSYMISQTKYFGFVTKWKFGGNDIIAWMPIPSFDLILEDNKNRCLKIE